MADYGDIANRVSLKDIANYLDMTSETISRIRAKVNKSKK
jgi:CRP-like cAMP-binding protein